MYPHKAKVQLTVKLNVIGFTQTLHGITKWNSFQISGYLCAMAEFAHDKVVPNAASGKTKTEQVAEMFDSIAGRYDFMNRFLSAGIDISWRKKMLYRLKPLKPRIMLDVATGTADVAIMAQEILRPEKIIGIDISEGMLQLGRQKLLKKQLNAVIDLQSGDS